MEIPTLHTLSENQLRDTRVLVRLDLNVPLEGTTILDDFRIIKSLPTLTYLKERGARMVIVSHLGPDGSQSLSPVAAYLEKHFAIQFSSDTVSHPGIHEKVGSLRRGEMLMLENLRRDPGEVGNDREYARALSSLGDLFVNEAFSVSHRTHASVVGVPEFLPSYAGFLFESEIKNLSRVLTPEHPFVCIIGGAKTSTKVPLLRKFLTLSDSVFALGAVANDFLKYSGCEIGISLSDSSVDVENIPNRNRIKLPLDVTVKSKRGVSVKLPSEVLVDDSIVDAGPKTLALIETELRKARLILWNGPLGNIELGFRDGTSRLARAIADSDGYSVVGGGDTVATLDRNLLSNFDFISTGGGAMLDFLAEGTLPGIKALSSISC